MPLAYAETGVKTITAYDRLYSVVGGSLAKVDDVIEAKLTNHIPLIPDLAMHLIGAGGKRVRPLLVMATTHLFNGDQSRAIPLAASIEFIHSATLLHDDVLDQSDIRRGKASANAIWGNQASILVGDFLFGKSFELMVEDGEVNVLRILSRVATIIIQGEILQMSSSFDFDKASLHYYEIIQSKTGQLFSAACEVGATISKQSPDICQAMAEYGTCIGKAFQCVDDLLDYFTDEDIMGKKPGDDFREGKITLPVILAYKAGSDAQKKTLRNAFMEGKQTPDNFAAVREILEQTDAYAASKDVAFGYVKEAQDKLSILPDTEMKDIFIDFADYCVARAY